MAKQMLSILFALVIFETRPPIAVVIVVSLCILAFERILGYLESRTPQQITITSEIRQSLETRKDTVQ